MRRKVTVTFILDAKDDVDAERIARIALNAVHEALRTRVTGRGTARVSIPQANVTKEES